MALRNPKPIWARLLCSGLLSAQLAIADDTAGSAAEVSKLVRTLRAANETLSARLAAVKSLERLEAGAAPAVSSLVEIMIHKIEDPDLRLAAASALQHIPPNEQTVPAFMVVLKDRTEASTLRKAALEGYWNAASSSSAFLNDFARILQDKTEEPFVREDAAKVLRKAATGLADEKGKTETSPREIEERLARLRSVQKALETGGADLPPELAFAIRELEARKEWLLSRKSPAQRLFSPPWCWVTIPVLLPAVCVLLWSLLLWRAPLMLWKVSRATQIVPAFKTKTGIDVPASLQTYLGLSHFQYHPRVLDAYLEQHWPHAGERFAALCTAGDGGLRVPGPVEINRLPAAKPGPDDFRALFQEPQACLVICGEPGSGKTSLAGQIAQWAMAERPEARLASHRMLAVWIADDPSPEQALDGDRVLDVVLKQTQALCGDREELTPTFLRHLLKEKRIVVIVDGLSEMSEATRQWFQADSRREALFNALIVTSRWTECLSGPAPWVARPLALPIEALPELFSAVLKQRGIRELFNGRQLLESCVRFVDSMVGRPIYASWARLYAEQMIGSKESGPNPMAPVNIPNLVLGYVTELCRRVPAETPLENASVVRLAKIVARTCVEASFKPCAAKREEIAAELRKDGWTDRQLFYLEHKLRLLRSTAGTPPRLRFGMGVVAEYLAAFRAVESLGGNEKAWRRFLEDAATKVEASGTPNGFIVALRECCLAQPEATSPPEFVEIELGKLAGLDPAVLEHARRQRRIECLVGKLSHPDAEERKQAALALGTLGPAAAVALPNLLAGLEDAQEDANVRCAAIAATGQIGADNDRVISILVQVLREGSNGLRAVASRTLARLGEKVIGALLEVARDPRQEEDFRVAAITTLGALERHRSSALSALIDVLRDKRQIEPVRTAAADALGRIGPSAETAAPDLIDVMPESKLLCRSAAQALIAIAPASTAGVIALVEVLNPDKASSPKDILTAFRRALVQPGTAQRHSPLGETSERIRHTLEESLQRINAQQESGPRSAPSATMPTVG